MERWRGRVALVTGASAGIGAGLCRALVQHGLTVVGCARRVDRIKAISEEDALKDAPGKLVAIKCDLTKESEILSMFDEIRRTLGRLDVCINNAGLGYDASLLTGSASDFRSMLDKIVALLLSHPYLSSSPPQLLAVQLRKHFGQLLAVLFHKLIDTISLRLQSPDLGQRRNLVGYRLLRYCLRFLNVAFENTLKPKILPCKSGTSLPLIPLPMHFR
ncbi:Dehydrogenase/reductase SDR family member 11 [Araneus ventricosus]|uniref:Dehydrogenase/reductase SDR family member 11 n=1 Tax=Araneus ventricosus TaxID=182803 RepID=A0A4Y2KYI7_ARAVE|nr:Dehydrogenase/reductase SDR family member 11 [Araneus ventricosus]